MDIFQQVYKALLRKYQAGATQKELADAAGMSQVHIGNLLSGKRNISGITLKNLVNLFPSVKLDLDGSSEQLTSAPVKTDIFLQVHQALLEKYHSGATQQELANLTGISQTHICNLLSGKRKMAALTLENLIRLFPDVSLNLGGSPVQSTPAANKLESKLLALFREMNEDAQLELLIYISRLTANAKRRN